MKEKYQVILEKAAESLAAARLLTEQGYFGFSASRTLWHVLCC